MLNLIEIRRILLELKHSVCDIKYIFLFWFYIAFLLNLTSIHIGIYACN
jgi:hypothetical protein